MVTEFSLLLTTTASLAFLHTLTGPDHYLPFIVISKARNWKLSKTIWFTALCGLGHVGSSVLLGFLGIALGIAVGKLEIWEGMRGSIISWVFLAFGLIYMVWGIRRAIKNRPHTHIHHHHDGDLHEHEHTHFDEHSHIHEVKKEKSITPWILFTIFIFGPCEPLIPIVMYPAAKHDYATLIFLTIVFSLITIATMVSVVIAANYGFKFLPMKKIERYSHALAGGTILACGMSMVFLGL
jgi:sulfite exporter TauE/SafE